MFTVPPVAETLAADLRCVQPLEGSRNTGIKGDTPCIAFSVDEGYEGTLTIESPVATAFLVT